MISCIYVSKYCLAFSDTNLSSASSAMDVNVSLVMFLSTNVPHKPTNNKKEIMKYHSK